jgi:dephospho-CoA kinase
VVPLLIESGSWRERVARILAIDCPEEVQVARVMARNGLDEAQVRAIMAAQVSREKRLASGRRRHPQRRRPGCPAAPGRAPAWLLSW